MEKKIQVVIYSIINFIVIAIVGTKSDLYANEEVKEKEAQIFARDNKCLFSLTSSIRNEGIHELIYELAEAFYKKYNGKPYIEDPNMQEKFESNQVYNNETIKLNKEKVIKKKSKCCGKDNK